MSDYSDYGFDSSNMGSDQYSDSGFGLSSWLKKYFFDPIPFLHEKGEDLNRELGYIDPYEWHMPEDEREISSVERLALAAVPSKETTSLGVVNPALPITKYPLDFFENLGKEDWELKKQAGEAIQSVADLPSYGDVATVGLMGAAKGVSQLPKAGKTLITAAKGLDLLGGGTALGVGGSEAFQGIQEGDPDRILGGGLTAGLGLLGVHEYLPTRRVNPVEVSPIDRSVQDLNEPELEVNWQDDDINAILGEVSSPETAAAAWPHLGRSSLTPEVTKSIVETPGYERAENIVRESIRRASPEVASRILDVEEPSKYLESTVDPTIYGIREPGGWVRVNLLRQAMDSQSPEEFAGRVVDTIAHEMAHQGAYHDINLVGSAIKEPYVFDNQGRAAQIPEEAAIVQNYEQRGGYSPTEASFVNRLDLIKHDPKTVEILEQTRQALSDPEIWADIIYHSEKYRPDLDADQIRALLGSRNQNAQEVPYKTWGDPEEWKQTQRDLGFPDEEIDEAIRQSIERNIDYTRSDTLHSLSDFHEAFDSAKSEGTHFDPRTSEDIDVSGRPPTMPQEPLIDKGMVTEPQPAPESVQTSVQGVQESVQGDQSATGLAPEPKQAGPKTFKEYLDLKFGSKATTSKERGIAKAEWVRFKEKQKVIGEAEKAGLPPDQIDRISQKMDETPKPEESRNLSAWNRGVSPVIENLERVHPELGAKFRKFTTEAEAPAMKEIAEAFKLRRNLSKSQVKEVIEALDGKTELKDITDPTVLEAVNRYRQMLDTVWNEAKQVGVIKPDRLKRENYFPHKFKEGWDSDLLRTPTISKTWELKDPNLEKQRLSRRGDYRRDLDVVDEYLLSAYRRISEVKTFGKRLIDLRKFLASAQVNEPTSDWLRTNLRRVLGREETGTFSKISGHIRHTNALMDLGLAGIYQPAQVINTSLYGGIGRSVRAFVKVLKDAPDANYKAIRSGALTPSKIQEMLQGAYGAQEGIKNRAYQKFMWGIPTIDKWTRIHADTVARLMLEDALAGNKGAIRDLASLGFKGELKSEMADSVGKTLTDKTQFRTGNLETPGWSSSDYGKLATQYTRFMYAHTRFVKSIFKEATDGNVRPLARFLVALPTVVAATGEVLADIRAGLKSLLVDTATGDLDSDTIERAKEAVTGEDEAEWTNILRNKRISWSHPLLRVLQNISMWGGLGVIQILAERILRPGTPMEKGSDIFLGPVGSKAARLVGSVSNDVEELVTEGDLEPKETEKWMVERLPIVGYETRKKLFKRKKKKPSENWNY